MQYLITTFTDSIGHTHSHVTKAKDNQTFTVVDAESKDEALEIAMGEVILRPVITKNYQPPEFDGGERGVSPSLTDQQVQKLIELSEAYRKAESGRLSPKPEKAPIPPRKGSE